VISHFFIDRPIFAAVLSIVITLAGLVAVFTLPVAQYPEVTPPTVQVTAFYPGANAYTVRDTVAAPIEEQVSGVENMMYMSSQCTNDGAYNLMVTFKLGTDSNMAQVLVQNRVALALPVIPALVQREGINVRKMSPSTLMIVNLVSPNGQYPDVYLSNYATIEIRDELGRLPGVAGIGYLGQRDYSLRAWLDPDKMASLQLSAMDVVNAIATQNLQVAAGQIGQEPVPKGQQFQLPINTLGRLTDVSQFADVILKVGPGPPSGGSATSGSSSAPAKASPPTQATQNVQAQAASIVRLRDVSSVELGAQQYDQAATLDGQPSVALTIYQLPGSNALETARGVYDKMEELKKRFPAGMDYQIVYDTTPFIRESVYEVFYTLRDAVILVALVVLVFLQNWRATIIPLVAVPVAIVGTFAVMKALGYSLNNLSLFGLVLAIGIVVDDAIVVVENVERWLERGEQPRAAARKAMDEVTGPVIAVALVLCAVFIPCAFISGITGRFFRQFAVTISVSTVFSAINSLTLSPALAAILLKPHGARRDPLTWLLDVSLGWLFRLFNRAFNAGTNAYTWSVGRLLHGSLIVLLAYGGLLVLTWWVFARAPTGFIPDQDQGRIIVNVQLPDAASLQRTKEAMAQIEEITRETPGVAHTVTISGISFVLQGNSSNFGSMFVILDPFEKRRSPELSADGIMARLRRQWAKQVRDAQVSAFGAPPIPGLSVAGGFKLMVEDRAGLGLDTLDSRTNALIDKMRKDPQLTGVFTQFRANTPQLYLDVDRTKVESLGVSIDDLNQALGMYLGSLYVNSFNVFGRYWQVTIQAEGRYRATVPSVNLIEVRNSRGEMVPLGTLATMREVSGPVSVTRYNLYTAAPITGNLRPGVSSGPAITAMDELAKQTLPRSMGTEWTELMFMQIRAGNTAMYVFALAVVFVFLALAALYESWSLPLAVILVVPLCLLCSVAGVLYTHDSVNIFVQIGLVVLVGLACKNAILIVEFAQQLRREGRPRFEATTEAVRLRLRPILMTSLAFILGVVPLVIATGAGAEMRRSLGTAVFSGMVGVTLFGIFLTPVFFYVLQGLGEARVFNSPRTQRLGFILIVLLNVLFLGLPSLLFLLMRPLVRRPDRPAAPADHADPEGRS
jgi:hydrophobe/amphiphile efflux-1 (HAE1) family protein